MVLKTMISVLCKKSVDLNASVTIIGLLEFDKKWYQFTLMKTTLSLLRLCFFLIRVGNSGLFILLI